MTALCSHFHELQAKEPRTTAGCEECLEQGSTWLHLRHCLVCGHVGCCDSSPHRHASAHFRSTGHAIIRSFEPGEHWGWCYVDEAYFEPLPEFGVQTLAHE